MSYKQRFLRFHTYFSTFAEDVFASSICAPFSLLIYLFSLLYNTRLVSKLPENVRDHLYNAIQTICMLPTHCLKGLASILTTPLALIWALRNSPAKYASFEKARFIGLSILAMSFLADMILWSLAVPLRMILPLIWIPLVLLGYRKTIPSVVIAGFLIAAVHAALTLPSTLSFSLSFSLGMINAATMLLPLWLLGSLCLCAWLEGKHQLFTSQLANGINFLILRTQFILMRFNKYPFKNKQSAINLTDIDSLPTKELFISHSNHAFVLAEFEENIDFALLHWYEDYAPFEPDDFLDIEQHTQLHRFPQLKQFIKDNREHYLKKSEISKESLNVIHEFGKALGQDPASANFNTNLIKAREAFDKQLKNISIVEKNAIEKLTFGSDRKTLKAILESVAKGIKNNGECKGFASSAIINGIERIERNSEEDNPPFWRCRMNKKRSAEGIGHFGDLN